MQSKAKMYDIVVEMRFLAGHSLWDSISSEWNHCSPSFSHLRKLGYLFRMPHKLKVSPTGIGPSKRPRSRTMPLSWTGNAWDPAPSRPPPPPPPCSRNEESVQGKGSLAIPDRPATQPQIKQHLLNCTAERYFFTNAFTNTMIEFPVCCHWLEGLDYKDAMPCKLVFLNPWNLRLKRRNKVKQQPRLVVSWIRFRCQVIHNTCNCMCESILAAIRLLWGGFWESGNTD